MQNPLVAEVGTRFNLFGLLFCFLSGPLRITVRTPVGGYTPGQIINVQINARNQSDQPVSEFRVQLLKVSDEKNKIEYQIYISNMKRLNFIIIGWIFLEFDLSE